VPPDGVIQASVNRQTGEPTEPTDPEAIQEYFIREDEVAPAELPASTPPEISLPVSDMSGEADRSGANGP